MSKKDAQRYMMERKMIELMRLGKSQRYIANYLQIGRRRIARIQKLAKEMGYLNLDKPLPEFPIILINKKADKRSQKQAEAESLLLPHKEWIKDRLACGWKAISVYEQLTVETSKATYYRFLHHHKLYPKRINHRVIPEIIHQPGEALLVDWGKLKDVIDPLTGKKKTIWMFVGVLGHSRYLMVRLVYSNSIMETQQALKSMFDELGGAPQRIISDNPKCFATKANFYEPVLNPQMELFMQHYGCILECLPPADPQKKGKVERMMPFVRRMLESVPATLSFEELQLHLDQRLIIANQRIHGTTHKQPIQELIQTELAALKRLPVMPYEPTTMSYCTVHKDGHVRFDRKSYSVAEESLKGEEVLVIASPSTIRIYHQGTLLTVHQRISPDDPRSKSTHPQHRRQQENDFEDQEAMIRQASVIGDHCVQIVKNILSRNLRHLGLRRIVGILALSKSYEPSQINEACQIAIELDVYSYNQLKQILDASVKTNPQSTKHQTHYRFTRPMNVYQDCVNPY